MIPYAIKKKKKQEKQNKKKTFIMQTWREIASNIISFMIFFK